MNEDLHYRLNIESTVEIVQKGDKQAYANIIRHFQKQIYTYCYSFLGNQQDAEDAVQDIFIKAFEQINRFTPTVSFSAWLYKIAYYHCINLHKKRNRWSQLLTRYKNQQIQTVEPKYEEIIYSILENLSKEEKHILLLRAIEEYSFNEIGIMMDLKPATIRKKYERLRKKIAKHNKEGGLFYEEYKTT